MADAKVGVFRREPIEFAEEQLVEVIATGERFRFGRAEYSANWVYTVWCTGETIWVHLIVGNYGKLRRSLNVR